MTKGFSLLELLVAMALMAVVAVLVVFAIQHSSERAEQARKVNNLRQIGVALLSYAGENQQRLPVAGAAIPYGTVCDITGQPSWQEQIEDYVNGYRPLFHFPKHPPEFSRIIGEGYFIGSRAAYVEAMEGGGEGEFGPVFLNRIQRPASYILAGEVGPAFAHRFENTDADRDNYTQEPAFGPSGGDGETVVMLLFADGRVEGHTRFDQERMTTRYDGPGLPW